MSYAFGPRRPTHNRVPTHREVTSVPTSTVLSLPPQQQFCSEIAISDWEQKLRNEFEPSRGRHLPAIIATAAAGSRRSGVHSPFRPTRGSA